MKRRSFLKTLAGMVGVAVAPELPVLPPSAGLASTVTVGRAGAYTVAGGATFAEVLRPGLVKVFGESYREVGP